MGRLGSSGSLLTSSLVSSRYHEPEIPEPEKELKMSEVSMDNMMVAIDR